VTVDQKKMGGKGVREEVNGWHIFTNIQKEGKDRNVEG